MTKNKLKYLKKNKTNYYKTLIKLVKLMTR